MDLHASQEDIKKNYILQVQNQDSNKKLFNEYRSDLRNFDHRLTFIETELKNLQTLKLPNLSGEINKLKSNTQLEQKQMMSDFTVIKQGNELHLKQLVERIEAKVQLS